MKRFLYLSLCALVFAGIVHIVIILLIPKFGSKDAWTTLSKSTRHWSFEQIDPGGKDIASIDPYFKFGACRFDLEDAGLLVEAPNTTQFWSASVFDGNGKILYSLTNRSTIGRQLQLLVLNPVQRIGLREFQPRLAESAIVVEADIASGFFVLRLFSPDKSYQKISEQFMEKVGCRQYVPSAADNS